MINNDSELTKKGGSRKPRGGKVGSDANNSPLKRARQIKKIQKTSTSEESNAAAPFFLKSKEEDQKQNVILHLKCSSKDLCVNEDDIFAATASKISSYNEDNMEVFTKTDEQHQQHHQHQQQQHLQDIDSYASKAGKREKTEIAKKLKILDRKLHYQLVDADDSLTYMEYNQKSTSSSSSSSSLSKSCFYDTECFSTRVFFIPKYILNNTFHVYGCFCSLECAVGFLMTEKLDNSTKFERLALLHNLYLDQNGFKSSIKPAPSPFYLLDKYYGNLTIDEYRQLSINKTVLLCIDKPITKIIPEYHEDNDSFMLSKQMIPNNNKHVLLNNDDNNNLNPKQIFGFRHKP